MADFDKASASYIDFRSDFDESREVHWLSVYHQLSIPICSPDVKSILEFGPGRGLFGLIARYFGHEYCGVDVDTSRGEVDVESTIKDFQTDKKYDLVCAFQTLEHNPPEDLLVHLKKMAELSSKYVFISLPYSGRWISFCINVNVPKIQRMFKTVFAWDRLLRRPRPVEKFRSDPNPFQYHWFEVGDKGFSKADLRSVACEAGLKTVKDFHSVTFPYHYFMLFEKVV